MATKISKTEFDIAEHVNRLLNYTEMDSGDWDSNDLSWVWELLLRMSRAEKQGEMHKHLSASEEETLWEERYDDLLYLWAQKAGISTQDYVAGSGDLDKARSDIPYLLWAFETYEYVVRNLVRVGRWDSYKYNAELKYERVCEHYYKIKADLGNDIFKGITANY